MLRACDTHPNVIKIIDAFEDEFQLFFVLEYLDGEDLNEYLKGTSRITESESLSIFKQIAEGLRHVHEVGIVHRDIKLENIMLLDNTADS